MPLKPEPMSSNELREYIFDSLGIENTDPWINIPTPKLMDALRENAGYTQSDVARQLGMSLSTVGHKEKSSIKETIDPILAILHKRYEKLGRDGWLKPDSLRIKEELYEKVANACRKLRGDKSGAEFEREIKGRAAKNIYTRFFETSPFYHQGGECRTPSNLMDITEALCAYYKVRNVWELIHLASKIPERIPSEDAGKATGALLDFMGLNWQCLTPKVFAGREDISRFVNGISVSPKKINLLPDALLSGWQQTHPDEKPPEAACFTDLPSMVKKGLRLGALDKSMLRDAISSLCDMQKKDLDFLAAAAQLDKTTIKNWFKNKISSQYGGRGVKTYHIAKMAEALGVKDIFALEDIGRAAAMQARSDQKPVLGKHTEEALKRGDRGIGE